MGMFNKSSSSVNENMLKEARRRGKRDGKNEGPRQDWGAGSVPYLGQLNKQFILALFCHRILFGIQIESAIFNH